MIPSAGVICGWCLRLRLVVGRGDRWGVPRVQRRPAAASNPVVLVFEGGC